MADWLHGQEAVSDHSNTEDSLAVEAVRALGEGDVDALRLLLAGHPSLVRARLARHDQRGAARTLLHVATDWPGHLPHGIVSVTLLVQAGADVNARLYGTHGETPLHWAASSDDVEVLDALLDAGADIEASGAVIAGGTPLDDATAFAQWKAARRLVERGARVNLFAAASLGLMPRLEVLVMSLTPPAPDQINDAFWGACHGGQLSAAEYLREHGARLNWRPDWEPLTPMDAAVRNAANGVVAWLHGLGAESTHPPNSS